MDRRSGMALWIVVAILMVMGILFFAFHLFVRQQNAQAHALHFGQVAQGLADAGANLAWRDLRARLLDRTDPLHRLLVDARASALAGQDLAVDLPTEVVEALVADLGPTASVVVSAHVVHVGPLQAAGDPVRVDDPLEKRLVVEVQAAGTFRGMRRSLAERRPLRVQLDNLPVLSKFTLFVKEPELAGAAGQGYNLFANDINGRVDVQTTAIGDNYLPLVLYNHGQAFAQLHHDVQRNGWVFLGGDTPVRLNLTSGAHYKYGQYFHFYNFLDADRAKQAGFLNETQPPVFTSTSTVAGVVHKYYVKHVIYGYFTVDAGQPPSDMNTKDVLRRYFLDPAANKRSSVLHLFGSTLAPSPARVFGPVYHSYPIYSGLVVDVGADGSRDGFITLLPAILPSEWSRLPELAPLPTTIPSLSQPGQTIFLNPDLLAYDRVFGTFDTYNRYRSVLVDGEAYNRGLDYMLGRGEFPPQQSVLRADEDYPNTNATVELRRLESTPAEALYFRGGLDAVEPSLLERRAFVECPSAESFRERFLRGGRDLHLGSHVFVKADDLVLPDDLRVVRGGAIMSSGSIRFDGVRCESGERLALVALGGDVTSTFGNASEQRPAQVDLAALAGTVACSDQNHAFAVRGTVAAKRFTPAGVKGGGTLIYPLEADPTAPAATRSALARVHLADAAERWGQP